MNQLDFMKIWDSAVKDSQRKLRSCMVDGCNEIAIKSHALQKNGILKQISHKNHLYQFSNVSAFQTSKKGPSELAKIGINDVYTFPGFCKRHDSSIFKSIEKPDFDIKSPKSINLFSYRALCQEIRRKEIAIDFAQKIIETNYDIQLVVNMSYSKKGFILGLKNLYFFKKELEEDFKEPKNKFIHKICELPRTEICISAPLNIYDSDNELSHAYNDDDNPFVTSFINIFPYKDKSFLMVTLSNDFYCNWTDNLFDKFQNIRSPNHLKLISDLITTRLEFWCISPRLKNSLNQNKLKELTQIFYNEVLNFDKNIETKFNLFE